MTLHPSQSRSATLWITLLTAASAATTLVLACATPFPALAALAAFHLARCDGYTLMVAAWAVSQAIGFGVLGYPRDPSTLAWAAALLTAALASAAGAQAALRRCGSAGAGLRLAAAYLAAFLAFKLVVLAWSFALGGVASALDPAILARQFARNGAILLGLLALYRVLVATGVPAPRRPELAA